MSTTEESIFNLIPRPEVKIQKPPMYRSKFPGDLPPTGSTFCPLGTSKIPGANLDGEPLSKPKSSSFGPPGPIHPNPRQFLRSKKDKGVDPKAKPSKSFKYQDETKRPPVPSRKEKPVLGLVSNRNFVTANAVEAILSEPKRVASAEPDPCKRKDYGKVPAYLHKVKQEIQEEYDYLAQVQRNSTQDDGLVLMPEEERLQLLDQLKQKWETTNQAYQKMAHMVKLDTIGKVRRKEQAERELQELEKDIERLSKPNVYIQR